MQIEVTVYAHRTNEPPTEGEERQVIVKAVGTLEGNETGKTVEKMFVTELSNALTELRIGDHGEDGTCVLPDAICCHLLTPSHLVDEVERGELFCAKCGEVDDEIRIGS